MIDFRLKENRMDFLERYTVWQLRKNDVDTAIPLMNYIFNRNEYNDEQRLWFCFLYGNTYDAASALALWNEMPDANLVNFKSVERFNSEKGRLIHYENDVKYSKMYLDKMSESYLEQIEKYGSQRAFFNHICPSDGNPYKNYEKLRSLIISDFYKFGRYVSWFYMQALKDCAGVNIDAPSMQFGYQCESPTDGFLMILGREEECTRIYVDDGLKKVKQKTHWSEEMLLDLEERATEFIDMINRKYPDVHLDRFKLETILCSIKKTFRRKNGRYLGYYLDRLAMNVRQSEEIWFGVDYNIITDWLDENNLPYRDAPSKEKMNEFLDTGTFIEFNDYEDLKNG